VTESIGIGAFESGHETSHPRYALGAFVLLAGYVLGEVATGLAMSLGISTVVSPGSGIAVAGVLILGYRAWYIILFGSLLSHLIFLPNSLTSSHEPGSLLIAVVLSAGAPLQAILGAALVKRKIGYPNAMDSERAVLWFLVLAGPASCLLGAAWTVGASMTFGDFSSPNLASKWLIQWTGDAIGVIVFAPLILTWLGLPRDTWRQRRVTVGVPLFIAFLASAVLLGYTRNAEADRVRLQFEGQARALSSQLHNSLLDYIEILYAIERLVMNARDVDPQRFSNFVSRLYNRHPGIQALEWIPKVTASDREGHEARVRSYGYPDYRITERASQGQMASARQRETYFPVAYVAPYKGTKSHWDSTSLRTLHV
jgi:integral membrane sensor domain MASE1